MDLHRKANSPIWRLMRPIELLLRRRLTVAEQLIITNRLLHKMEITCRDGFSIRRNDGTVLVVSAKVIVDAQ